MSDEYYADTSVQALAQELGEARTDAAGLRAALRRLAEAVDPRCQKPGRSAMGPMIEAVEYAWWMLGDDRPGLTVADFAIVEHFRRYPVDFEMIGALLNGGVPETDEPDGEPYEADDVEALKNQVG